MKLKNLSKFLLLSICFVFASIWLAACGDEKVTLKTVEVNNGTLTTQIAQNTDLEEWLSGVEATLTYSNGETATVSYADLTFSEFDTSRLGEQTLTITYNGVSYEISIEVFAELESIDVVESSIPTVLQHVDADFTGLKILAHFTDGDREISAGNFTIDKQGYDKDVAGSQSLKVVYSGKEKTFNINVQALASVEIDQKSDLDTARFAQNEVFNYRDYNITVTATWANGSIRKVENLTTFDLDTTNVGISTLTATYKGVSDSVEVGIVEHLYVVSGWEDPSLMSVWKANSQLKNTYDSTYSNGTVGYEVLGEQYIVGSDNAFIFKPIMHGIVELDDDFEPIEYTDFRTNVKVWIINGQEQTLLTIDEEKSTSTNRVYVLEDTEYLTIENNTNYIFTEQANNKNFRIQVKPYYITEEEDETIGDGSIFEFKVVSGYNVYDAAGLSVFDNVNAKLESEMCNNIAVNTSEYDESGKWTKLKEENGVLNKDTSRLILHSNVNIKMEDIPSIHYYVDEDDGKTYLFDHTRDDIGYIYYRKLTAGQSFTIEGNYFTISVAGTSDIDPIAPIIRERNKTINNDSDHPVTSHTSLFKVQGVGENTNFYMNNLQIVGNSPRSNNRSDWGGIIGIKFEAVNSTVNNVLSQRWFITSMYEGKGTVSDNVKSVISNSNYYDANNTLIYAWGVRDLLIDNCKLIGAGGPVIIADHVENTIYGTGGYPTNVKVNNSILESRVSGEESWFVAYDATEAAAQLKGLDALLNAFHRTFLEEHTENDNTVYLMNLIAVFKSAEAEGFTASGINCTFEDITENDSVRLYNEKLVTNKYFGDGSIHVSTASSGGNITIGMTLDGEGNPVPDPTNVVFTEDDGDAMYTAQTYMYMYYANGMCFIFGLSDTIV